MFHALLACLVLGSVLGYGALSRFLPAASENMDSYNVCSVQPNISPQQKWDTRLIHASIDRHIALTQQCVQQGKPDLIVWPETAVVDDFLRDPGLGEKIIAALKEAGTPMVIGAALYDDDQQPHNSAVFLDEHGHVRDVYYKQFLVPFTEFFPFERQLHFLRRFISLDPYEFIAGNRLGLFSRSAWDPLSVGLERKIEMAICSESAYPGLFRRLVRHGADMVLVLVNDAWFQLDSGVMMHAQNLMMRAAENKVPIMQSTNTGWSGAVDHFGQIDRPLAQGLPLNTVGVKRNEVRPHRTRTLYNHIGDIFAVLCVVFVIISWIPLKAKQSKVK